MCSKIAVLLSGNGSNLKAIIDKGTKVSFVASNNPKALGLQIAKNANIPSYSWMNVKDLEQELLKFCKFFAFKIYRKCSSFTSAKV